MADPEAAGLVALLLSDLSELSDEIDGVEIPPGMVGPHGVWLHTTSQVQEWLQTLAERVRRTGEWNPWGDACHNCDHPESQHDDSGCLFPKWDKSGGTTCYCAGFTEPAKADSEYLRAVSLLRWLDQRVATGEELLLVSADGTERRVIMEAERGDVFMSWDERAAGGHRG